MSYKRKRAVADFRRFANEHQLSYAAGAAIPRSTLALMHSAGRAHSLVAGRLPGGFDGLLADYGYKVQEGNRQVERHCLVLLTRLLETVNFIPCLLCQDIKTGGVSDVLFSPGGLITSFRTVEFESLRLHDRYRVAVSRDQDENWLRQLFDPVFIDWLATDAPDGCYFELMVGVLCVSSADEPGTPGALERLCEFGSHVAERLRSEVGETEGLTMFLPPPSGLRARAKEQLDRKVARVTFNTPPPSVRAAAKRYRWAAMRRPGLWIRALVIDAFILVLPAAMLTAFFRGALHAVWAGPTVLAWAGLLAVGLLLIYPLSLRMMVRYDAIVSGFEAFVRGYATSRGLTMIDPLRYQAEHTRLRLPGGAFRVLSGLLPAGAGEGTLLAFRQLGGRRAWQYAALAAVTRIPIATPLPLMSLSPRGSREGFTALGGFVLEEVAGLERFQAPALTELGLDPRLLDHYDVVVDDLAAPAEVRAILTPDLVAWLLPQGEARGLGFALEGADAIVFTAETELMRWSEADLDSVCSDIATIRGVVLEGLSRSRPSASEIGDL